MATLELIEGMINLTKRDIIAKTNVTADVLTSNIVTIEDSFNFEPGQEIVLIDYGYETQDYSPTSHYGVYEYARIKEVTNTTSVVLYENTISNWYTSDNTTIQKTIGHSPLYDDRVYYGDREVIPSEEMSVTFEPVSLSNEWIYIMGGLSREYRVDITIYGKDIKTEEGMQILNKYTDAIYDLFNDNLHINVESYETPLLVSTLTITDSSSSSSSSDGDGNSIVVIEDTEQNREYFKLSSEIPTDRVYEIQDNLNIEIDLKILNIVYKNNRMYITVSKQLEYDYTLEEYAVFRNHGRYFYDTRIDSVDIGQIQKGSAFIRAARLSWFGKEVEEHRFPQKFKGGPYFKQIGT